MDAAYFAAGTLCHMLIFNSNKLLDSELAKSICLQICKFENPSKEMVVYRSFRPFITLLDTAHSTEHLKKPAALMWALWAIHHVTTRSLENEMKKSDNNNFLPDHGKKYLEMIKTEGIIELSRLIRKIYQRDDLCSYDVNVFVMDCGEGSEQFKLREVFTEYESNMIRHKILDLTGLIEKLVSGEFEEDLKN